MNNYKEIAQELNIKNVTLVAVSKTKPNAAIQEMYDEGQRIFGENRVQELTQKHEDLPKDIQWHLIGHLQTNKVKYVASFVQMIHSVESLKLLAEINKQAKRNNRVIDCLLQMRIAQEETKFGMTTEMVTDLLNSDTYKGYENIRILGVMGMATFTDNKNQVETEFKTLKSIFHNLKENHFSENSNFKEISMGMSGDYKLAIEAGSTMVRIGSLLFGSR
jgi:pyridoxal phosphate enzyme (YggS family)